MKILLQRAQPGTTLLRLLKEIPLAQVLTAVMYLDLSNLDSLSLNTDVTAKIYQII